MIVKVAVGASLFALRDFLTPGRLVNDEGKSWMPACAGMLGKAGDKANAVS